uniref:Rhodanese domain-containing protein n=1 Tax=Spongospora subterranea TaxID=70186 RepID=A0A0H5QVR6_9EUKA|eukprot:CRZ06083.1 hypothetical protein [Spongospora subterranea]
MPPSLDMLEISAEELIERLLTRPESVVVVDVRDSDQFGGQIRGCISAPSTSLYGTALKELVDRLSSVPLIVFHCMKSQVRGPKAMQRYAMAAYRPGSSSQVALLTFGFENFIRVAIRHSQREILLEKIDERIWPNSLLL